MAAAVTLALVLAAGCGDDEGGGDGGWPPSGDPVDATGPVYAVGDTVHLGDGSTIGLGDEPAQFLLAGDGVYFVPATGDGLSGQLLRATPDGVTETGAEAEARSLRTSPDRTHLAFIDLTTGEEDQWGTPVATAVVVDLASGEEVVRTTEGMGDPDGDDDLFDLYEDADGPSIVAVTDEAAYVSTPTDGIWAYDLASGDGEKVADSGAEVMDEPWYPSLPQDSTAPVPNPSGTWSYVNPSLLDDPPFFEPADGAPVTTRADLERWGLAGWLDDETALGIGGDAVGEVRVLVTCTVPTGRCTTVEGTEGGVQLPLDGLGLD